MAPVWPRCGPGTCGPGKYSILCGFFVGVVYFAGAFACNKYNQYQRRAGRQERESSVRRLQARVQQLEQQERAHVRQLADAGDTSRCGVCWEKPRDTVLEPCRHAVMCHGCVDELLRQGGERRIDQQDSVAKTKQQFLDSYGGTFGAERVIDEIWDAALRSANFDCPVCRAQVVSVKSVHIA